MPGFICPPCARRILLALVLLVTTIWSAGNAQAQLVQQYFPSDIPGYSPDFSASVATRMSAQNQAKGVEAGDFVIRPQLTESTGYNSNTLGTPGSGSSEAESAASVRINSDWSRDAIGASLSVDNRRYLQLPSASFTNWTAGAGGSLTLGNDTATLAYSHLALNLAATDLGVEGVVTPVPYSVDDFRTSYVKLFSRFSITPSLEYSNFAFGQSRGAIAINYNTLSHQTETGTLTTLYELSPGDAAVGIFRTSEAQFKTAPADDYFDAGGFVGLDFRTDSVIQYRALVGLENRQFPKTSTAAVTTPTFELDIVWTPTDLDTFTGTAVRRVDDPTSPFASNQIITDGRLQLDHELHTNWFVSAYAEDAQSQSQSSTAALGSDNETQLHFGLSTLWNINRNLRGTLSYSYSNGVNSSTAPAVPTLNAGSPTFTSNTILVGFSLFE